MCPRLSHILASSFVLFLSLDTIHSETSFNDSRRITPIVELAKSKKNILAIGLCVYEQDITTNITPIELKLKNYGCYDALKRLSLKSALNKEHFNGDDISNFTPIYYDLEGHPVPQISSEMKEKPTLKWAALRYGWLPCSCQNLICGCCSNINIKYFNYQRKDCMNFSYNPKEFALNMDMIMNEKPVYHNSISGKNPPPACLPVSAAPLLPGMEFCIKLYNIYTAGSNINVCVNFETKIVKVPVLILHFDCFRMGADGFAIIKPDAENAGLPTSSTALPVEDSDPMPLPSTEFYDEVIEEKSSEKVL